MHLYQSTDDFLQCVVMMLTVLLLHALNAALSTSPCASGSLIYAVTLMALVYKSAFMLRCIVTLGLRYVCLCQLRCLAEDFSFMP